MAAKFLPPCFSPKPTTLHDKLFFNPTFPPPSHSTVVLRRRPVQATGDPTNSSNSIRSGAEGSDVDGEAAGKSSDVGISSSRDRSRNSRRQPLSTLNIRYRSISRKQAARQRQDADDKGLPAPAPPKQWEEMTLGEKAVEIYVGEKGLLFWLNKFAYASIFIIIGGWILFRFVGPSLGLYQLDTAPLSPTAIFKG